MHPFHMNLSIVYLRATTSIPPLPRGDDSPASRLEVTRILETKRVEIYFEEIRNDSINLSRSKDERIREVIWLISNTRHIREILERVKRSVFGISHLHNAFSSLPPEILSPVLSSGGMRCVQPRWTSSEFFNGPLERALVIRGHISGRNI